MTKEEFKKIRLKLELNQQDFGKIIYKSERMVRYYENGKYEIPPIIADKLTVIL